MAGAVYVIAVFADDYITKYPVLPSGPVVLIFSPKAIKKLSFNALAKTHKIQPQFTSLNTPSLRWISVPFANADAAKSACEAINDKDITEAEKADKINEVIKWYVDGKEQKIN